MTRVSGSIMAMVLVLAACGDAGGTTPVPTLGTTVSTVATTTSATFGTTAPGPGPGTGDGTPSERRVHDDPQNGYRLSYPAAWVDQHTPGVFHIQAQTGVSGLGIFSVTAWPEAGGSLDDFAALSLKGLLGYLRDASVQEDVTTMLAGVPARSVTVVGYTPGGTSVTWLVTLVVHQGRGYDVVYSGSAGGFEHFLPDALSILDSWEFTAAVSVFDLEVGHCFDDPEDGSTSVQTVPVVPCSEPHDNEIYHAFDLPDGPYPGAETVDSAADEECLGAFEPFVGIDYFESALEFFPITPTSASWAVGDRTVYCALYALDLSKLTGTMRGSQR